MSRSAIQHGAPGTRPQGRRTALWLGLAFFAFYLLTTSAHAPYGDESIYVEVADIFLREGKFKQHPDAEILVAPGGDGLAWSKFGPGQSILLLPFVLAAQHSANPAIQPLLLNALGALECALIVVMLFLLAQEYGLRRRAALCMAATAGLATQLWPYASTQFSDTSAACLLLAAYYFAVSSKHRSKPGHFMLCAGFAIAGATLCKSLCALAVPALVVWIVWSQRGGAGRLKSPALFLAPVATAVIVLLWYNNLRYGSPWTGGYHRGRDGVLGFSTPLLHGLRGMFLSPGRSAFIYSPPCLLALLGARAFARRRPGEAALIAGMLVPLTLAVAKWWSWHGGAEWGCRIYFFLVPFLLLLSAPAWEWLDRLPAGSPAFRLRSAMLGALLAVSLAVQAPGLLIDPQAYWSLVDTELPAQVAVKNPSAPPVRDTKPLSHFEPSLSPVAAQWWMVWATIRQDTLSETQLAQAAPFRRLGPQWTPRRVLPHLGFDRWLFQIASGGAACIAAATSLFALLVFSLWKLFNSSRRYIPGR